VFSKLSPFGSWVEIFRICNNNLLEKLGLPKGIKRNIKGERVLSQGIPIGLCKTISTGTV
jgi:hypothetical protein